MKPKIAISYPSIRSQTNPVKRRLFVEIGEWADVTLFDPLMEHPDLVSNRFDLYHMARQSTASLADLKRACRGGVQTVNPYDSVDLLSDRFRCLQHLEVNNVRVPDYAAGTCESIDLEPPIVIRSRHEIDDTSHRITTVLGGQIVFEGNRVVEKYVPSHQHVKIHRLGDETRAVAAIGENRTAIRECEPTRQMTAIADRGGDLTKMTLFEIDLVGNEDLSVVDVNSAVSVTGIADGKQVCESLLYDLATEG